MKSDMSGTGDFAKPVVGKQDETGRYAGGEVTCYGTKSIFVEAAFETKRNRGLPVHNADRNRRLTVHDVSYSSGRT